MAALVFPSTKSQFFDNNGDPLSLGTVEITFSLTSNPAPSFLDAIKSAQNEYPIRLTAAGKADIYLEASSYNIVTKDLHGVIVDTTYNYIVETPATPTDPGSGNVPIGGIIMYTGYFADIPASWRVCDGMNGTPNLHDRFIRGTSIQGELGNAGGSDDATLKSHTHAMVHQHAMSGIHTHEMAYDTNAQSGGNDENVEPIEMGHTMGTFMLPGGAHQHDAFEGNTGSTGDTGDGTNLPSYYTLAYIQRVA